MTDTADSHSDDMSRVASLTAIFDHLLEVGLLQDDDWRRLRAQAQARAVDWPEQNAADQAAAWCRGSLPDHEYRSARLHLDLKDALDARSDVDAPFAFLDDLDQDLRTRVAVYEAEQAAAVRADLDRTRS